MDDSWKRVEPLMPLRQCLQDHAYTRKAGGGRNPKAPRLVFEDVVYELRTGCQWKASTG
jgi:transposase